MKLPEVRKGKITLSALIDDVLESPLGTTGNLTETRLLRYLPKIGTYCSHRSRESGSELCNAGTDSEHDDLQTLSRLQTAIGSWKAGASM